jgi:hypothetical protein
MFGVANKKEPDTWSDCTKGRTKKKKKHSSVTITWTGKVDS